ncbi:fluoride efflux transporter CrcB [Gramella sp. AN32]|nr:fluoride efflux transporter CrcB [Gramella sp. AN32]
MKNLLLIFLGGGLGSCARYLISKYFNQFHAVPLGTFTVNILGSLILGFFIGWALKNNTLSHPVSYLIIIGFCGGFTTFSTFSLENLNLIKSGDYAYFVLYLTGSIFLGILSIVFGIFLARSL